MLNSPLHEQSNQRATVIPLKQESLMLDMLEFSNCLIVRDFNKSTFSEPEEEISDFLAGHHGISNLDYDNGDISLDDD
jgi:hypothetical protein